MQSELEYKSHRKYYLSNRDLLIIAILSGIGGVMSTYVGYLGNFLNRLFGVPFGAGQFLSGLHIFWIILAAGLVRLPGAATAAGLLKGVIELFTGSTHGVAIVFVSLAQGLFVDLVLLLLRRHSLPVYALAGGMGSASNVLVFQALYFSGAPLSYILFIAGLSFFSSSCPTKGSSKSSKGG
jgi:ABC-type thiamin/hydroxymethylpyrimidine transport system permease subunit